MTIEADHGEEHIECPRCRSKALYRNGKTYYHLQRYICLMCGRQFVPGHQRDYPKNRPECPTCGAGMHSFKKERDGYATFRCSRYPVCRTYVKSAPDHSSNERRNCE